VRQDPEEVASPVAPIVPAASGGTTDLDAPGGREWLWRHYERALISVEVAPGQWVVLKGTDASEEVPFGFPVHVITAWNPDSVIQPATTNDRAQKALMSDLRAQGVMFYRALGRSSDGDYSEDSLAVVGLDRSSAKELGLRYGQAAVFEVDEDTVTVVACGSDRASTSPRRNK